MQNKKVFLLTNMKEIFHAISIQRKKYFSKMIEKYDLTQMEIDIVGFLSEQPDNNTFTDIMKAKDYAKSHISNAITHLVNGGCIEKCSLDNNKKVHKLFLLNNSKNVIKDYNICIENFRKDALVGIKESEIKIFEQVISKMHCNLSKD